MSHISWRLTGAKQVDEEFRRMRDALDHPEAAFEEMLQVVADRQIEWFDTEGSSRWVPLSPRYRKWKESRFPGRQKLFGPDVRIRGQMHYGGALRDELTRGEGDGSFGIEHVNDKGFEYGSTLPYAYAHQNGTGRLPRRRPLRPMDRATMNQFAAILGRHLEAQRPKFTSRQFSTGSGGLLSKGGNKGRRKGRR